MNEREFLMKEKELKKNLKEAEIYELICVIVMVITIPVGLMLYNPEGFMAIAYAVFCSVNSVIKVNSIQTELRNLYRKYLPEDYD